ncbi:uncharacterized protein LOC117642020 [Thrips palmi]|uniref:Uncharacterized protein LOC117642020 n=1 Tax=Thrips palmi TaxID=161013 RepID=A0A6P8YNN0_THRPL|nr:uncharacterized protein LOC117642020 [Thrips palmi]
MSLLLQLPDELLVMILNYCATADHVHISRVCMKLNAITCDRKLVKVVNFHYQTDINKDQIKRFLALKPRADNITTIDLTSCYWLTSSFIQNLVIRLTNVQNILLADTTLIPSHLKNLLQTLSRITRLSWTWRKGMDSNGLEDILKRLEFLYLCIPESKCLADIVKWVNLCTELRELWINNIDSHSYMRCDKPIELRHLERIILYPCTVWPVIATEADLKQNWRSIPSITKSDKEKLLNIESIYAHRWSEVCHVVELGASKIERICSPGPVGTNSEIILSHLSRLTALNIVLPESSYSDCLPSHNLNLNELSLGVASKIQECSVSFCEMASTCPNLTYLNLPVQALVCVAPNVDSSSNSSAKRVSRVRENLPGGAETPFNKMVECTPLVEVFEIGVTGENSIVPKKPSNLRWDAMSLSSVGGWKHLIAVTLANLPINNGKFLVPILRDCTLLKSLKIVDLGNEAACVYAHDLYCALPLGKALQDFHWTQSYIGSTSKLWTALQSIPTLQRVALCLQGQSELEEPDIYKTMEECKRLSFLHLATCTTKVKAKLIKRNLMARWSESRPHLCLWLGMPGELSDSIETSPAIHSGEMLQEGSRIIGIPSHSLKFLSIGQREWAPHM